MQPRLGMPISPVHSMASMGGGSPVSHALMGQSPLAVLRTPTHGTLIGASPMNMSPQILSPAIGHTPVMGPPPIITPPGQPRDKRTMVAHVDASSFEPDLVLGQDDKAVLSVPPCQARVWVTWENGQLAAEAQMVELEFPTLQHMSMDYRFGQMELPIREKAGRAKVKVAELPATLSYDVKLSTEAAAGRVGFNDKLPNGIPVGHGIFEYELEGEGNLESEHRPECTILWLSCDFNLTGQVTCVNNVQPVESQ